MNPNEILNTFKIPLICFFLNNKLNVICYEYRHFTSNAMFRKAILCTLNHILCKTISIFFKKFDDSHILNISNLLLCKFYMMFVNYYPH